MSNTSGAGSGNLFVVFGVIRRWRGAAGMLGLALGVAMVTPGGPGGLWPAAPAGAAGLASLESAYPPSVAPAAAVPGVVGAEPRDDASTIEQQQVQVVTMEHQGPISSAQQVVDVVAQAVGADRQNVAGDEELARGAAQELIRNQARLTADEHSLAVATATRQRADATLAADRARLAGIAVGVYTGALSPSNQPAPGDFQAEENQVLDQEEVGIVAGIVDADIHRDRLADDHDIAVEHTDSTEVAGDHAAVAGDRAQEVVAAAAVSQAEASLYSDEDRLVGAEHVLSAAQSALASAISALAGPGTTPPGQLSLQGGSALTATQLVAWFNYEGYADLTSASIGQLAAWYLQFGSTEGVRGDVAFAQAVLETGGFSSPDAVNLSNFAGIGHCDSCSQGWAFPSPAMGVLGQVQLLRIFADSGPGPSGAPGPVLPQLTTADQYESGCCSTVESLTGVWATDPTYGEQILSIYSQMLDYALSAG